MRPYLLSLDTGFLALDIYTSWSPLFWGDVYPQFVPRSNKKGPWPFIDGALESTKQWHTAVANIRGIPSWIRFCAAVRGRYTQVKGALLGVQERLLNEDRFGSLQGIMQLVS